MKQPILPADAANDTDLQRIKARIRKEPFVLFRSSRLFLWCVGIGAAGGTVIGLWLFMATLLERRPVAATSLPLETLVVGAMTSAIAGLGIGGFVGLILGGLALFLFAVFRPVYVALRYSPEQFEREYGDRLPRL